MATTTTTTAAAALSLKLYVDTKAQRVLFAEAGKDVVDFLCSLLVLPVGAAGKLLGKESMAGIGRIHASVDEFDGAFVLPCVAKDGVLRPMVVSPVSANSALLLPLPTPASEQPTRYRCAKSCRNRRSYRVFSTEVEGIACPICGGQMATPLQDLAPAKGFVRDGKTYSVRDDLTIAPMFDLSGVTMIGHLKVKPALLGRDEALEILKASMTNSNTVLSDVFLGKAPA